jgi:hypothetical protein
MREEVVRAVAVPLVLVSLALTACSSEPDPSWSTRSAAPLGGAALTVCPTLLEEANQKACAEDGMKCTFPIQCTTLPQQATCSCQGGVFQCSDSFGPL